MGNTISAKDKDKDKDKKRHSPLIAMENILWMATAIESCCYQCA